MSAGMKGTKVLRFPVQQAPEPPPILAWWRCEGKCGALVTSPSAYCLSCAVEDGENG